MTEGKPNIAADPAPVVNDPQNTPENNPQNPPENNPPEPFDWSKIVGDGGALAENWRDALPEDIRNEKCFDSIKNFGTLAKSFASGQKLIGGNKVSVPGENSPKEDWDAFFKAGGRPDSADAYQTGLPEGASLDEDSLRDFRTLAYENGLSQKAFAALVAFDAQRAKKAEEKALADWNSEYRETEAKLRQEYADQYGSAVAQYAKAIDTFGVRQLFEDVGIINNIDVIHAFIKIGSQLSEAKLKPSDTPLQIRDPQRELDDLRADLSGPLYHADHPGHDSAVARVRELIQEIARRK